MGCRDALGRPSSTTDLFSKSRCCLPHAMGASHRRDTPTPWGIRPSTIALMRFGAKKASEIVMFTCRVLQPSRIAMLSIVALPAPIADAKAARARSR
jgi:hypothetical protein